MYSGRFIPWCVVTIVALFQCTAQAQDPTQLDLKVAYEEWRLPQDEAMGMARMAMHKRFGPHLSLGVDFYAAVRGERGGFITTGVSGEIDYPISRALSLEAGLFVGAGGGRGGLFLSGGGLMLRQNLGLALHLSDKDRLSLGYSHVDFPDGGEIESEQAYLGYSRSFGILANSASHVSGGDSGEHRYGAHDLLVGYTGLYVSDGALRDSGALQDDFGVLGFYWRSYLDDHWFVSFEAAGAMDGSSQGYMHLLPGGGFRWGFTDSLSVYGTASLGGAGGGDVATGGGLMWDAGLGLTYALSPRWIVDLSATRVWAPSGDLEANTMAARVGYRFGLLDGASVETNPREHAVRVRAANQQYTDGDANWRNRPDQDVQNMGVQMDYFLSDNWYLTGQGLAAYSGDAGAYMIGLLGTGYELPLGRRFSIGLEGLLGAAGGGGLNVGPGLVYQGNAFASWHFSERWELQGSVGAIQAADGDFGATVYGLALGYRFEVFSGR